MEAYEQRYSCVLPVSLKNVVASDARFSDALRSIMTLEEPDTFENVRVRGDPATRIRRGLMLINNRCDSNPTVYWLNLDDGSVWGELCDADVVGYKAASFAEWLHKDW